MAPDTAGLVAAILNACYMVRHYARGGRSSIGRLHRQQAILALGLLVRDAFNRCSDFEALLGAIANGLNQRDEPPF